MQRDFFYILRKADQHLEFDLELAKSKTNENPLYYIQYAHARICSLENQFKQKQLHFDQVIGLQHICNLTTSHETKLLKHLQNYLDTLTLAASNYEPHKLAIYLKDLASHFHSYYNAQHFITETTPPTTKR